MKQFTAAEDEAIRFWWVSRATDKEISVRLGRDRGIWRRRAEQLGLGTSRNVSWLAFQREIDAALRPEGMNDHPHPVQELGPLEAEHTEAFASHTLEEKAFRLAVARRWACRGEDTAQIAEALKVDEAAVYNVLKAARRMIDR